MIDIRWQYESEQYVAWRGPVIMGSVSRIASEQWEAWALGSTSKMTFKRLPVAQAWVEKRAEA